MTSSSWIILLPTIVTIGICLWTKKVYLGMFVGIFTGCVIKAGGNPLVGLTKSFDSLIGVLSSGWNVKIILFAILIGGLIELMNAAGGVRGVIAWLEKKAAIKSNRGGQVFTWLVGVILFFDQVTSEAVTATVGKTLADKYGFPRQKVAYIVDSTASPMCALLPFNSWGAYIVGLLAALSVANPMKVLLGALPFNFYCIFAILICFAASFLNWNIGPMKNAKALHSAAKDEPAAAARKEEKISSPAIAIVPLLVILVCVPLFLVVTGKGKMSSGDASSAVFWSVLVAIVVAYLMALKAGLGGKATQASLGKGIIDMLPVGGLLVFAFSLSGICGDLGVGKYIAGLTSVYLPNAIVPALLFFTCCLMSFTTGSSWGTFAIMVPIIVPMGASSGIPLNILLAAMLSGAIMGDHAAIMSDSTVMASIFSGCDNIDHFKTQLPYSLIAAAIALALFLVVGAVAL